jgi:hypothetical protein
VPKNFLKSKHTYKVSSFSPFATKKRKEYHQSEESNKINKDLPKKKNYLTVAQVKNGSEELEGNLSFGPMVVNQPLQWCRWRGGWELFLGIHNTIKKLVFMTLPAHEKYRAVRLVFWLSLPAQSCFSELPQKRSVQGFGDKTGRYYNPVAHPRQRPSIYNTKTKSLPTSI